MPTQVTVVVPSYRQARFLRHAIDSVLDQGVEGLEVLVLDGGSDDGTVEVLRSYGDRIWWRSEPDGGQCAAINEGFRRARGDVVAWLNSDDFYYPGAIRAALDALAAAPQAVLAYGEGNLVDADGALLWRFPETVPFDLWRLANVADYILQPTVFFRRAALPPGDLLDEDLNWGLDWDLWLRLGARAPFVHVDRVLAAGRIHDATKTATGGFARLREIHRILRAHGVGRLSPAGVAHAITTCVRAFRPTEEPVATETLTASAPRFTRGLVRPVLGAAERGLRRWLENAQGLWRDGLVDRRARLWLPAGERPGRVVLHGTNRDLPGQVVEVRSRVDRQRTAPLAAGAAFTLEVAVPDEAPVALRLRCSRTAPAPALVERLGPRRAGWELTGHAVVPAGGEAARAPWTALPGGLGAAAAPPGLRSQAR